ncbi:MAG: S41 family peptidase [Thermomonas sp.]
MRVTTLVLAIVLGGCTGGAVKPPPAQGATPIVEAADLAWRQALPVFQPEALQRDVDVLEATYGALHPGLHRYLDEAALAAEYARLREAFRSPRRLDQAYLAFSAFASQVRCGHTYANFFNQGEVVTRALLQRPRLPLHFRWIDGEMVVTADLGSGASLPAGTRVLALGGVPTSRILADLLPYARADGHNQAKRIAYLQRSGLDRYEAFDVFYPLLFAAAAREDLDASVVLPGASAPSEVRLRMQPFAAPAAKPEAAADPAVALGWRMTRPRPGVSLLRMPSWTAYDFPDWNWRAHVDGLFVQLVRDGTTDLVIDLRGNEGGDSVGEALAAHLVDADIVPAKATRSVRYRRVPDALRPHLSTWDKSFYDWGDAATAPRDGFYRLTRYDDDADGMRIRPALPRFAGRVWVLVGSDNSSATFEFAELVQARKLGTLVGEPTGGNLRGINGGAFLFMTLPGTGIELDVPLIAQFPATPQPDAGIVPDIAAPESAASIAQGRDVALDAVLARIASSRGQ